MKQIIAILIAFFVCAGATQVSAQDIKPTKTVTTDAYVFEPTDHMVMFTTIRLATTCTIPIPDASNKGRVLYIINRRENNLFVSYPNNSKNVLPHATVKLTIPYWQSAQLMCDGFSWFLLNKSF